MIIANSALRVSLAIYHLTSNGRSWNNCSYHQQITVGRCRAESDISRMYLFVPYLKKTASISQTRPKIHSPPQRRSLFRARADANNENEERVDRAETNK